MSDITVRFRYPLDGLFARSLVDDLERIASVEVIRPLEQRGGPMPTLDDVSKVVVLTLAGTLTKAIVDTVISAVKGWVKGRRSEREPLERRAVIYGPDGEVLVEVCETDCR